MRRSNRVRSLSNNVGAEIMADYDYWKKQGVVSIFPEVDTMPPEQRRFAGKVLIVGGNKNAFFSVASAMASAQRAGAGEVRVLLPASVKGQVPMAPEIYFATIEKGSGAFGRESVSEMLIQADWADAVILIGDVGKNAETTVALADFLRNCEKPVYVTRDAIDAITPEVADWSMLRGAETGLLLTLPQLQKMLRTLYYPKVVTLSMPTNQLIEVLHKFTISYPLIPIVTFHNGQIIVAQDGAVITEALSDTEWTQITLWGGALMVKMAVFRIWNASVASYKVFASALLNKS